jgi:CheY-like chemotaxis protein
LVSAKVLVVEDESIVAMGIKYKLESLGHTVVEIVSSGENAIKAANKHKPDVILMDIVLKGDMDGIDAAQIIHDTIDIPIIYLTAYADEEMLTRARVTEPYGYIIKPFKSSELNANIEMAIYKHNYSLKEREVIKKRIMADFQDFILRSMPTSSSNNELEMRKMLSNIFAQRLEEDMRPGFESKMTELGINNVSDPSDIFEAYINWIIDVFSTLGVRLGLNPKTSRIYLEFDNCPWIDESKKNPIFCLNCQSMINRSFDWTNLEGNVKRKSTIASGAPNCIFAFNL